MHFLRKSTKEHTKEEQIYQNTLDMVRALEKELINTHKRYKVAKDKVTALIEVRIKAEEAIEQSREILDIMLTKEEIAKLNDEELIQLIQEINTALRKRVR